MIRVVFLSKHTSIELPFVYIIIIKTWEVCSGNKSFKIPPIHQLVAGSSAYQLYLNDPKHFRCLSNSSSVYLLNLDLTSMKLKAKIV